VVIRGWIGFGIGWRPTTGTRPHDRFCAEGLTHLTRRSKIEREKALMEALWTVKLRHKACRLADVLRRRASPTCFADVPRQGAALTDPIRGEDIVLGALASQRTGCNLASKAGSA